MIIEGSSEAKLPTIWTDGKAEVGRVREEKGRREKIKEETVRRKKIQAREKVRKSPNTMFFQWFVAPEGWQNVGSLKQRVRSNLARWEMKKLHAVVARSKNAKHTSRSKHFWKLRCWKSARRCGTKHISKSKCTKHTMFGPLSEVEMLKKCTLSWREAHFQVKMYKTHHARTTFGSWHVSSCGKSTRCCGAKHISKSKVYF